MQEVVIDVVSDDAIELVIPSRHKRPLRGAVACLCCERANQPMDEDGCGICDRCLGLPVPASHAPDELETAPSLPSIAYHPY